MVHSVKVGNLDLHFVPNAKATCVCVVVGWTMKEGNWFVLNKLKRGFPCSCPELSYGSEHMSLAYGVYQLAQSKLLGDAKAQQTSKAASVSCGYQNDEFFICVRTIGTLSAVRKVLSVLEQCMIPDRLYPAYASNIKLLNSKPSRDEFAYCVTTITKSMQSLKCLVIGKAKFDDQKLALIAESASAKFSAASSEAGTKPYSLAKSRGESEFPTVKAKSPMAAIVTADFLHSALYERIDVNSQTVIVYNEKWSKPKSLDKTKVKKWVTQKYGKLADLESSLVFLAVSKCELDPSSGIEFTKKSATASTIGDLVASSF